MNTDKIVLRDDMTRNEMVSWFSEKLQRYPTAIDVYEVRPKFNIDFDVLSNSVVAIGICG